MKCPDEIRGKCCYFNIILEGYNIILSNQPCKLLNIETGLCSDYKNRHNIPHCNKGKEQNNIGGLPKGCKFLETGKIQEKNPKIDIKTIVDKLKPISIAKYNFFNNIPKIERFAIKNGL